MNSTGNGSGPHSNGHAGNGHAPEFDPFDHNPFLDDKGHPDSIFDLGESDFGAENTDPTLIEPRGWLLGNWFCREFVSSLVGDGAAGKTALRIACAMALATKREDILGPGLHVFERVPVLYLCFEDGERELHRRLWAAMLHHGVHNADIAGFLYVRAITRHDIKLAVEGEFRRPQIGPLKDALERSIDRRQPGLVILDPLVKIHGLEENNNIAMDLLIEILTDMSIRKNTAIDVPQHTRKGVAIPGDADRARGASAVKDGGRLVYTTCDMSAEEADNLGVSADERLDLMRIDSGKVNIARRSPNPIWFRRVGVSLGNTKVKPIYPRGDTVQTVERWYPPTVEGLSKSKIAAIFDALRAGPEAGEFYSPNSNAKADWAGLPIAQNGDMAKSEARRLLRDWIQNKVLIKTTYTSPKRHKDFGRVSINEIKAAEILGGLYRPSQEAPK
jgi:hypothetical protein